MQIVFIIGFVILASLGTVFFMGSKNQPAQDENTKAVVETTPPVGIETQPNTQPVITATSSVYADGTYTGVGSYASPAGTEEVSITLTLSDDVVTAATFEGKATNPASINNQKKFADGYETLVVGKPLNDINLTVVNGSSLTSKGFMEAVTKIRQEARS